MAAGAASAQTYGFATLPPGSLNHTTASAISKVMKEKGGMNMLVQPTAGDNVIIPMVGRGEVEIGITNIMEAQDGFDRGPEGLAHHHRRPCAAHAVLRAQGLRHAHDRRPQGQARDDGLFRHAQHRQSRPAPCWRPPASPRPTSRPMLVPNVVRSADDFMAGNCRHVLLRLRRPEGARGRRHRRRPARPRDGREGHARRAQDHAVGLCHPGRAGPDLHRRREADEGLRLRQRADHIGQGEGRSRSTRFSRRWRRTRTI